MKRFLAILLSLTVLCQAVTATGSNDSVPERRENSVDSMQYLENVIVYGRKPYAEVIPAQVLSAKTLEGLNSHSVADADRRCASPYDIADDAVDEIRRIKEIIDTSASAENR